MCRTASERVLAGVTAALAVLVLVCAAFSHVDGTAQSNTVVSLGLAGVEAPPGHIDQAPNSHEGSTDRCSAGFLSACVNARDASSVLVLAMSALGALTLSLTVQASAGRRRFTTVCRTRAEFSMAPSLSSLCVSRT